MKFVTYLLRQFFKVFLASLFLFVLILGLVDLFVNLWQFISHGIAMSTVLKIEVYYLPKAVWYAIPISMLFSTAFVLSEMYSKNELLAIFASGTSLFKFTSPLLVVALIMSIFMFFFDDKVVVPTYAKKNQMQKTVLNTEDNQNNDRIVIISDRGDVIYKADYYDNSLKRLYGLYVLIRDEDKDFETLIYSENAAWNSETERWDLNNCVEYIETSDGYTCTDVEEKYLSKLTEVPSTFKNNVVDVQEVSTKEAREYIAHLEKAGLPCAKEKSELHKKFSFPFVCFIVVFLAIGLSGRTKKNVLIISLALSIASVVVFYVLQMVTMLMAKFGVLPPLMGAWLPIVIFIIFSIILLKYTRT